ncbi:hypothetical protein JOD57_001659 [Geodermatophilus bullaregiensis]|uniref:chromate resistance protein ChrB domain-containing protein n=1 Tax=Geodermatophilus bullaregiensis TaxID=1564160 RepID=UPI00195C7ABF|nr:chromate resistance protein ChrB domain-containing protein [Geodermatophilus bullaregiensis]MBM7805822.1 hypothetical protein [Geodermatophilus bullaregiensis]
MRWATRAGVHIDRAACAWLIRRFLDPDAAFLFVADPTEVPPDATPFDVRGVDLGHHGGDCSFETILRRYELTDPVLWRIAEIVHEADLDDERFDAPEAPGVDVVLRGLSMTGDDEHTLAVSGPVFDGLYEFHRRRLLLGREPADPRRPVMYSLDREPRVVVQVSGSRMRAFVQVVSGVVLGLGLASAAGLEPGVAGSRTETWRLPVPPMTRGRR